MYYHQGRVLLRLPDVALMFHQCGFVAMFLCLRPLAVLKDETNHWSQSVVWTPVLYNWLTVFQPLDHQTDRNSLLGVGIPVLIRGEFLKSLAEQTFYVVRNISLYCLFADLFPGKLCSTSRWLV